MKSALSTVWKPSVLRQTTVVPTGTVTIAGSKAKFLIRTSTVVAVGVPRAAGGCVAAGLAAAGRVAVAVGCTGALVAVGAKVGLGTVVGATVAVAAAVGFVVAVAVARVVPTVAELLC